MSKCQDCKKEICVPAVANPYCIDWETEGGQACTDPCRCAVGDNPAARSTLKDSGKRKEASTGAVRDASEGKAQMFYLSPHVMPCPVMGQFLLDRDLAGLYKLFNALVKDLGWTRFCDHLDAGADKYSAHNWQKGMCLSWVVSSYMRHYVKLIKGDTDEDHAAARLCNLMFTIHYVEELDAGRLPAELDDMPRYAAVVTSTGGTS